MPPADVCRAVGPLLRQASTCRVRSIGWVERESLAGPWELSGRVVRECIVADLVVSLGGRASPSA
jgi:hypothetical protein